MQRIIILKNLLLQGIVKAASTDRSIKAWTKACRREVFVSITCDDLNVMFSLGYFSAAWCWRLLGLVGKRGLFSPVQLFMHYQI